MGMKRTTPAFAATLVLLAGLAITACGVDRETKAPDIGLHEAVLTNNVKAVERHVAAGSDIDAVDAHGSTPMTVAATFGRPEIAEVLIEAGADLGKPNGEGSTPLHIAAFFCREDIVRLLLEAGADRTALNPAGLTPADMAAAPFDRVRPIYDGILESLGPLGLTLDYERIEETRPAIARILSE